MVSGTFGYSVQQALHLDFLSHVEMTSSVYKMWLAPGYLFRGPYPPLSPPTLLSRGSAHGGTVGHCNF